MRSPGVHSFLNKTNVKSSIIKSAMDAATVDIEMKREESPDRNKPLNTEQQKKLEALSKTTGLKIETLRLI